MTHQRMYRCLRLLVTLFSLLIIPPVAALLIPRSCLAAIEEVQVASQTSSAAIITWITAGDTDGCVHYGLTTGLGTEACDPRPDDDVHFVQITGLTPSTQYFFEVISNGETDDNGGAFYAFTTAAIGVGAPYTVYGQVLLADGTTPAEGALVHLAVTHGSDTSLPLAALTNSSGNWSLNLGTLKSPSDGSIFPYATGDLMSVSVQAAGDGHGSIGTVIDGVSPQGTGTVVLLAAEGGACCLESLCSETTEDACIGLGGQYQGDGTTCSPDNPCVEAQICQREAALGYPRWEWVTMGVTDSAGMSAPQVFASLLPNLNIVKNDVGQVYIPGLIDVLSPIVLTKAYALFLESRPDTLLTAGTLPDLNASCVTITQGRWNLIPYLTDSCSVSCASDVTDAMESISACVDIVKDNSGDVWIPALGLNTLGRLDPRRGYYVFLSCGQDQTLCYPPCTTRARAPRMDGSLPQMFRPEQTGMPEIMVVVSMEDNLLGPGDEVGVFSGDRIVGAARFQGEVPFAIPVWRGDQEHTLPGFSPGEPMSARVLARSSGVVSSIQVLTETGREASFEFDPYLRVHLAGVPGASGGTSADPAFLRVIPNPVHGEFAVHYRLAQTAQVRLEILDTAGQLLRALPLGSVGAGPRTALWDGANGSGEPLAGGIYFLRLVTEHGGRTRQQVQRLVVIK